MYPPQVRDGSLLGVSPQRGGRLHLPLSPHGPEDPQAQTTEHVVQEDAGQGLSWEDPARLQGQTGGEPQQSGCVAEGEGGGSLGGARTTAATWVQIRPKFFAACLCGPYFNDLKHKYQNAKRK